MDLCTNQNTISRYETGEREPGIAELIRIADYFGVSIDYLLGRSERSEPATPELSPESREILDMYADLTPEQQSTIKITMQSMLVVNDAAALEKKKIN